MTRQRAVNLKQPWPWPAEFRLVVENLTRPFGPRPKRLLPPDPKAASSARVRKRQWMADNASVSWVQHPEPWYLEAKLLTALDLPLNIQDNEHNAFAPQLKKLRRDAAVKAGKMRVLAEWS